MTIYETQRRSVSESTPINLSDYDPADLRISHVTSIGTVGESLPEDVKIVRGPVEASGRQIAFLINVKALKDKLRIRQLNRSEADTNTF